MLIECFSVMMIVFFPVIGAVADRMGFKTAFVVIFTASVPVLLLSRWLLLQMMGKERASVVM